MDKLTILLVEDKPSDVRLIVEAFKENKIHSNISVVGDGEEALKFLFKKGPYKDAPDPNIVLLDLKLPKKNGHEVLKKLKGTEELQKIPVIILSNSDAEKDIEKSYGCHANCYITKPFKMADFIDVVKDIEKFWLNSVKLPKLNK